MTLLVAVMALAGTPQQVPILSISGNDMWEACSQDSGQGSACNSYVAGVLDTYAAFEALLESPVYCVPDRATYGQATDVVTTYLRDRPGQRHFKGVVIVLTAVREAFDCDNAALAEADTAFRPLPPVTLPIAPR